MWRITHLNNQLQHTCKRNKTWLDDNTPRRHSFFTNWLKLGRMSWQHSQKPFKSWYKRRLLLSKSPGHGRLMGWRPDGPVMENQNPNIKSPDEMKQSWAPDDISSKGMRALYIASLLCDHMSSQFTLPSLPVSHWTQLVAVLARSPPTASNHKCRRWMENGHSLFLHRPDCCLFGKQKGVRVEQWGTGRGVQGGGISTGLSGGSHQGG